MVFLYRSLQVLNRQRGLRNYKKQRRRRRRHRPEGGYNSHSEHKNFSQ